MLCSSSSYGRGVGINVTYLRKILLRQSRPVPFGDPQLISSPYHSAPTGSQKLPNHIVLDTVLAQRLQKLDVKSHLPATSFQDAPVWTGRDGSTICEVQQMRLQIVQ